MHQPPPPRSRLDASTLAWFALLIGAVAVYALGLGGQYIPTNGDEMVYTHIARLTAESGHWLPLVSELDNMRNTKPPLLFWQAIIAGDWGNHWHMAALRAPSVIYTLLTTGAVAWSIQKITRNLGTACLAACVYLAFFCTFRFGRPFLTSAPETFWLNLPMFCVLWHRLRQAATAPANNGDMGWLAHAGFGLALGLGLAYKSFALIAPAAAALWCAQLLSAPTLGWHRALTTTLKVGLSSVLALSLFALWFALDPDPAAVWREFVVGENAGKMNDSQGYWQVALAGGSASIWVQLLAYVQNAGLLAFVVLGLMGVGIGFGLTAWKSRHSDAGNKERFKASLWILLAWLAVWLVVFTVPSQRSARYVIPAMPALAMMIAIYWHRIARGWFLPSLILSGIFIVAMGRIAWAAHDLGIGTDLELTSTLIFVTTGLALVTGGLLKPAWSRACAVAASLVVFACFGLATQPLNGASGHYGSETRARLSHATVAIPSNFNGQFEQFGFLLPGNRFVSYSADAQATRDTRANAEELERLMAAHDAVVWMASEPRELAPPCAPDCTVLGSRWEVKGRHRSGEINLANLWYPQGWLFRREWLVLGAASAATTAPRQAAN